MEERMLKDIALCVAVFAAGGYVAQQTDTTLAYFLAWLLASFAFGGIADAILDHDEAQEKAKSSGSVPRRTTGGRGTGGHIDSRFGGGGAVDLSQN
jgi:hypothetical protein